MNHGQVFLRSLVDDEIAEACCGFVGLSLTNKVEIKLDGQLRRGTVPEMMAAAVRHRLCRAFGAHHDRLSIGVIQDQRNPTSINIIPGNLYTFLLMSGLHVHDLPGLAISYRRDDSVYYFVRGRGGWVEEDSAPRIGGATGRAPDSRGG